MDRKTGAVVLSFLMVGVAACGSPEPGSSGGGGASTTTTTSMTGGAGGAGGASITSAYDPSHVIEVAISMDPADWDKLRGEANDLDTVLGGDCLAAPLESAYNYYVAQVDIDGQSFPDVDIRKKGFIGSLSLGRPSLKLKLDTNHPGAHFLDVDKLTLNNMKQDGSRIRTCLSLEMFQAAGVPASRCSFAHVTVNGEDLGVYTNVEALGAGEMAARFADGTGNLYEGVISDFRPSWENTYQKKTNTLDPDRSDVQALTDALTADDAGLLAAVDPLVDMDAFLSFWAMESLVEDWDGYTHGQNNHLVYHDPTTKKLYFLPWGPDGTFGSEGGGPVGGAPLSVYATSELPRRLYGLPEVRSSYRDRLLMLNDKIFVSGAAGAAVDRMEALLAPLADKGDGVWKADVEGVRQWVKDRPGKISAEIASGPVEHAFSPAGNPCFVKGGTASGSFKTKMGTLEKNNPFGTGSGAVHLDINAMPLDAQTVGGAAGFNGGGTPLVLALGVMPGGEIAILVFLVDAKVWKPGDAPFDLQAAFGVYGTPDANGDFIEKGWLDNGTVHFDKVGLTAGDEVTGTFTTEVFLHAP